MSERHVRTTANTRSLFLCVSVGVLVAMPARADVCLASADWGTNIRWVHDYQAQIAAKDRAGLLTIALAEQAVEEMKLCVSIIEYNGAISESVDSIKDWIVALEQRLARAGVAPKT